MEKRIFLLIVLTAIISSELISQRVISGKTKVVRMDIEPEYEFTLPPNLFVKLNYEDDNNNGILEAEEKSKLTLSITNMGKGPAQGMKVNITTQSFDPALQIGDEVFIRMLRPDETKEVIIPVNAGFEVKTDEHRLQINVAEHFGYDMDPAILKLTTLEFQKPRINFSGMEIYDKGEGTMAIIEDGQLQAGEMVKAKLIIQNIGNNVAKDIRYNITANDKNIIIIDGEGIIPSMQIGEIKEIWISISPNKRFESTGNIPVFLTVTEEKGVGNLNDLQLPLALNERPPKTETLVVKADIDKIKKQVAVFEYTSEKYSSNVSAKNIEAVPVAVTKRPDAVAVVIGVEDYQNIGDAPFAAKDAEIMSRYFRDVLGVQTVNTHINGEVSGFFFDQIFDPVTGKLVRVVKPHETDVFVYYSGHGIPEKDGNDVFLFPSDGNLEMLEKQGYSLNRLYENLEKLNAKSVTVMLDACFSGSSRASGSQDPVNISNTRGVVIKELKVQPWLSDNSFRVLASSTNEQTSLGFDAAGTGLFTYYVCIGLQGEADLNGDKTITVGELEEYLIKNVSETSRRIRGEQTPVLYGNADMILVQF